MPLARDRDSICRMFRAVQARRAIPAGYLALGSRVPSHSVREFQEKTLLLDCKKIPSRSMSQVSELVQFPDLVATLQDMLNQFRAQDSAGMNRMANGDAKGSPAAPPAGAKPSAEAQPVPAAARDAQARLDREADQTETPIQQYVGQ
jgi:hypothetical protein